MKKAKTATPIVAAVMTATGCIPMNPVDPVVQADDPKEVCRIESPIDSHVKEVICSKTSGRRESANSGATDGVVDEDVNVVFRDITVERSEGRPIPLPEASCGAQRNQGQND